MPSTDIYLLIHGDVADGRLASSYAELGGMRSNPSFGCSYAHGNHSNLMPVSAFLVEDSAVIRKNLIPTLAELGGVSVVAFAEGQTEALDWLKRHEGQWQLVIVDLFLKEGSGLGIIAECKGKRPESVVVVLTNYATADMRRRCLALGADAFFDKSGQLEEFFEYCEQHFVR